MHRVCSRWARLRLVPVVLLAGLVLWLESSPYPTHLETAYLLSDAIRHHPAVTLYHPVWSGPLQWIGDALPRHIGALFPLLQIGWAMMFLALTGSLLRLLLIDLPQTLPAPPRVLHNARLLGIIGLAALPPFRRIALHPHPVLVEATLILAVLVVLFQAIRKRSQGRLIAAGLLAGLAALETALAWPLIFLLAGLIRWGTDPAHRLPATRFLGAAGCSALPLLLLLRILHPSFTSGGPGTLHPSIGSWMGTYIRGQFRLAEAQFYHSGWILNLILTAGLSLIAFAVIGYRFRLHRRRVTLLLMMIFVGLQIALLVPSPLPSYQAMCFTAFPWVFSAINMSFLFILLSVLRYRRHAPVQDEQARFRRVALVVLPLLWLAWAQTRSSLQIHELRAVHRLATAQLHQSSNDTVLLSNGALDPWLRLAAHADQQRFFILRPQTLYQPAYAWEAAQVLPELDELPDPPWSTLEAANWISRNPHLIDRLRILDASDPWTAAGFAAVPETLAYRGASAPEANELLEAYTQLLHHWSRNQSDLERLARRTDAAGRLGQYLLALGSRQFNQIGIVLEKSARPDEASHAYQMAVALLPDNISAILNQAILETPDLRPDDIRTLIAEHDLNVPFSVLLQRYGHIAAPEALAPLLTALRGTRTGPQSAPADAGGIRQPLFDAGLALYEAGQLGAAKAVFERLALHHDAPTVLNNLAWIELQLGNLERAERWVDLALQRWPDNAAALDTWGAIFLARGQFEEARTYFEHALSLQRTEATLQHLRQAEAGQRAAQVEAASD